MCSGMILVAGRKTVIGLLRESVNLTVPQERAANSEFIKGDKYGVFGNWFPV